MDVLYQILAVFFKALSEAAFDELANILSQTDVVLPDPIPVLGPNDLDDPSADVVSQFNWL